MYFVMGVPPIEITTFQMGINNLSEILIVEAEITEMHKKSMDKNGSCSNSYTDIFNFNVCSRNIFLTFLKENTNCSLPGKKVYFKNDVVNTSGAFSLVFLAFSLLIVSYILVTKNPYQVLK